MGYTWGQDKDGRWRLDYDGHHANPDGQYLGAAVWFEFLFGKSVMDNKFVPPELAPGDAAVLRGSLTKRSTKQANSTSHSWQYSRSVTTTVETATNGGEAIAVDRADGLLRAEGN